jgi:hypothetical protein
MNALIGISPEGFNIFPVMWDLKKRLSKVSHWCNNMDTNKEKEKVDRNAPKGRGILNIYFLSNS